MSNKTRVIGGIIAACGGVGLVAVLLWTLAGFPGRANPGAASTSLATQISIQTTAPLPEPTSSQVAAEVNGESITLGEWEQTTALEQAINHLAGKPPSTPEMVLERLINERITLQASRTSPTPKVASPEEAEARLQALMQAWGANEADLDKTLTQAGLTRQQFLDEISRLLVVEYILQATDGEDGGQSWLKAQREQARISIFANLNDPTASASNAVASTQIPPNLPTGNVPSNLTTPIPSAAEPTNAPQNNTLSNIENIPTGVDEGQLAPDFTLQLASGSNLTLSELRGRPVVLNFWATWCPVCRKEIPALQAAAQKWASLGVTLVAVGLREDAATVNAFAAANNLTFTLALDTDGAVAQNYQVLGIPTTLFIDSDGVVRSRFIGPLTEAAIAERVTPLLPAQAAPDDSSAVTSAQPSGVSEISVFPDSPYDFTLDDQSGNPFTLSAAIDGQKAVLVFFRGST